MPKPNFFIVGAPKCGTTALSHYLRDHQNVFISAPKEPHYFATDIPRYRIVSTEEDYYKLFDDANDKHLAIGDASVLYLYSNEAIQNIHEFDPNAKIIAMFRNPADLVYSMHSQLIYSRDENEEDFGKAWELTEQRKNGDCVPHLCRDEKVLYYDEIAKMGEQLESLLSIFPQSQIKVIFFEDFVKNTHQVYSDVLEFLGLPDDHRTEFPRINENKQHRFDWLANFTERVPNKLVAAGSVVKRMLGLKSMAFILIALRKLNMNKLERKPLNDQLRIQILQSYHGDIAKLSQLTGKDLSHWLV